MMVIIKSIFKESVSSDMIMIKNTFYLGECLKCGMIILLYYHMIMIKTPSRRVSQVWDDDHEVQELYRYTSFDRLANKKRKTKL